MGDSKNSPMTMKSVKMTNRWYSSLVSSWVTKVTVAFKDLSNFLTVCAITLPIPIKVCFDWRVSLSLLSLALVGSLELIFDAG